MSEECHWCGFEYSDFTPESETLHLRECPVFSHVPIAFWKQGRPFVQLPGSDDIFVERIRPI